MAHIHASQAFYALTLMGSTAAASATTCNVIPNLKLQDQQLFVARGEDLYLYRINESETRDDIKLVLMLKQKAFGIVRGVAAFRIPGTATDQLVVASDSGRAVLLNYDAENNRFKRVHQENFGRSGIRRTVPGQYLASDPRGRCFMLASVEKNKVVYMVNRNAEGEIIISSPHEANQWATLCFGICALDTGWEHPAFAAIELDYNEAQPDDTPESLMDREKRLTYYTVDLGLNHVVKQWSTKIDPTANMVFGVPGGKDGPSGVLVCAKNWIYYIHKGHQTLRIAIPRRKGPTEDKERKRHIVAGTKHLIRGRVDGFFFLLQTEDGDVFRLDIDLEEDSAGRLTSNPSRLRLKYYETFPVATTMLLIRKGYVYVSAENGNDLLYHVNDLAEDLDVEPWNNFHSLTKEEIKAGAVEDVSFFKPRQLTNTFLAAQIDNLHPLIQATVDTPANDEAPAIHLIHGAGNRSAFKTIKYGISISETLSADLQGVYYDKMWGLKQRATDEHQSFIVLSSTFSERTVMLKIDDETVETMPESDFVQSRATLTAAQMGMSSLVQVHARGVRTLFESGKYDEWRTPPNTTIVTAAANQYQLIVGLSSSEVMYFFFQDDGTMNQLEDMPELSGKITAMAVAPVPRGRQQASHAVVGCDDCTIRVFSVELNRPLEQLSVQALSAPPTSIEIVPMWDPLSSSMSTYAHIGLQSGLYIRAFIDDNGELDNVRTTFLGTRGVQMFKVEVEERPCVIACSSRAWIGHVNPKLEQFRVLPLLYEGDRIDAAATFNSVHMQGLCLIVGANLLIGTLPQMGEQFTTDSIPLEHTPRAMTRHPELQVYYVIQCDGNTLSKATKNELKMSYEADEIDENMTAKNNTEEGEEETEPIDDDAMEKHLGLSRGEGHNAACVSVIEPVYKKTINTVPILQNEQPLSVVVVPFEQREWRYHLLVATLTAPRKKQAYQAFEDHYTKGCIHVYELSEDGEVQEEIQQTLFDEPPYAMCAYKGYVAIGQGHQISLYGIGMKHLLRVSMGPTCPNMVTSINVQGDRFVVGDVRDSVTYVVYKSHKDRKTGKDVRRFIPFADDTVPRWTTAATMVDYETTAGGDKFGNLWLVRCPEQASDEADEQGINQYIRNERSYLHGAPYRLDLRAHFFVHDIPKSLQRTPLVAGGADVLFWAGLQGTLGMLVPFVSREDVEFFTQLEVQMRAEEPPIAGRDHLMYRGYYVPVKGVIDGDLCERFFRLPYDSKQKVAAELERPVREVEKKVEEMRTRVAF